MKKKNTENVWERRKLNKEVSIDVKRDTRDIENSQGK